MICPQSWIMLLRSLPRDVGSTTFFGTCSSTFTMKDIFPYAQPEFPLLQLGTTASCLPFHCAPLRGVYHLLHNYPTDSWSQTEPPSAFSQLKHKQLFEPFLVCHMLQTQPPSWSLTVLPPILQSPLYRGPEPQKCKAKQENLICQPDGYVLAHIAQPSVFFSSYKFMLPTPAHQDPQVFPAKLFSTFLFAELHGIPVSLLQPSGVPLNGSSILLSTISTNMMSLVICWECTQSHHLYH